MSENDKSETQQVEQRLVFALVETNPSVQAMAKYFGWKPKTVIARIQSALPSIVEQQMYLSLGADYRIEPETLKTILRTFLGERELTIHDIGEKASILDEVIEFQEEVLTLMDKKSLQYRGLELGAETASKFVITYGKHVEEIIDGLDNNIVEISTRFKMENHDPQRVIARAIHFIVWDIGKYTKANGTPDIIEIIDFFRDSTKLSKFALSEAMDYYDDSERSEQEMVRGLIYGNR